MSKIAKIIEALEVASAHLHKGLPEDGKADYALIQEALGMARELSERDPVAWMHWLHGPVRLYMNKDEAMLELDRLNKKYPINEGERQIRPLIFGDAAPAAQQPQAEAGAWRCCPPGKCAYRHLNRTANCPRENLPASPRQAEAAPK